jgi:mono/diheme cytochrome c family protein
MKSFKIKTIFSVALAAVSLYTTDVLAQEGEATFKKTCAVCHSIGGGKLVGPDLKDVHTKRKEEWLLKFIKGSQSFIQSGDADAKAIFEEFKMVMPDQNLSDAEIKAVIAYIGTQSGGAVATTTTVETAPATTEEKKAVNPDLIKKGKALYEGSLAFTNGGASCLSCHNVNYPDLLRGGTLAKDLTSCFSRLGGGPGVSGILTAPPFPAMTNAFKNNPLTAEEIEAVVAFLEDADAKAAKGVATKSTMDPLVVGGIVGFGALMIIIIFMWRNRKIKSTKDNYHNRQAESIN